VRNVTKELVFTTPSWPFSSTAREIRTHGDSYPHSVEVVLTKIGTVSADELDERKPICMNSGWDWNEDKEYAVWEGNTDDNCCPSEHLLS